MDDTVQCCLQILPLNQFHKHKNFKSGKPQFQPLKTFLQQDALAFQDGCIARTYVAVDDNEREDKREPQSTFPFTIMGYITLICSQINLEGYQLGEYSRAERYKYLPAVKIARLAVDSRMRSLGIGNMLFSFALSMVVDNVLPIIGCRFLITDAKQEAVDFYHKQGMELLFTDENQSIDNPTMFIDLHTLL